jgi:hypothetical protein
MLKLVLYISVALYRVARAFACLVVDYTGSGYELECQCHSIVARWFNVTAKSYLES